ncbi:hypothetical protein O1611_g7593 [Lasiodiplodia mahajangana]|uniref:Uncharacterized protein n=1 Tax=Lasiodiplodia mahajangana TaxID=1108764 RepID=A0ACC2JF35_9PEZI|nr:hypothetical protein O1611_g7593 [Lasiodiplodia mahajangana]
MSNTNRFAELRQVILRDGGLTRAEARYVGFLLSDLRTDLVGESPLEIVMMIALHLPLRQLALCLRVSKVWRQRFLSGPVIAAYARHNWPAMVDGVVNPQDFLATLSKFGRACQYMLPRYDEGNSEIIPWFSQTHYQLDPIFHARADDLPSDYTQSSERRRALRTCPSAIYFSGKVAWCLYNPFVVVDDLRSKTRKVFTLPSGVRHGLGLALQAVGSRLVVATLDRLVIAWDHVDNHTYEKSLPSQILCCATENNRVAFVTYSGDAMVWTPGHAMLQLNPSFPSILKAGNGSSEAQSAGPYLYPFFDARNGEIIYLASAYCFLDTNSKAMVRITIHEVSMLSCVASWSCEYEEPATAWNDQRKLRIQSHPSGPEPEPRILMTDYELDRSCILIFRQIKGYGGIRFAAFDKLERKFINIDVTDGFEWTLLGSDYASSGGGGRRFHGLDSKMEGRIDLDFMVNIQNEGYGVTQL